ncbi:MAG: hypothetical protein DRJ10_10290 [Bacteroidetes bacterium]|nr:MAG: hypothetical protein DRJ10_10290 [Bacteroidota bacterium]
MRLIFKKIVILLFILWQINIQAQPKRHEIGAFIGTAYYMGDLNDSKLFYMPSPAFGLLYRYDLNSRYALKITGTYTTLRGDDSKSENLYQRQRAHSFSTRITEVSPMIEFNFLPFSAGSQQEYYSVYVTTGVGILFMQSPSNFPIHPVIPFGLGFKYGINRRIVVAAEWTYRKTFTDYIDQLLPDEYGTAGGSNDKQRSYDNSKDWYSFAGITFTYKFALGSTSCPAYGKLSK